ncbi:MAG: prepilin-type N-terminal cleavage/methylation domain-containing protein [Planctomycetota bacterium]
MRPPSMRRGAFTLIELLVSVSIIALLIAILLPALAAVRSQARTTQCLKQAQQSAVGVMTFAGDNKGRLPANRTGVGDGDFVTWRYLLSEGGYISAEACVCPAHPGREPASELGVGDRGAACVGDIASSYALNGHLLWQEALGDATVSRSDVSIARPSHTILITETRARFPDLRVTDPLIASDLVDAGGDGGVYGYWHRAGGRSAGVYSFSDGHAEAINMVDTGSPDCRWHSGKDWGEDPFDPQIREEVKSHDHPDWELLLHPVYLE